MSSISLDNSSLLSDSTSTAKWACDICTFHNEKKDIYCTMCNVGSQPPQYSTQVSQLVEDSFKYEALDLESLKPKNSGSKDYVELNPRIKVFKNKIRLCCKILINFKRFSICNSNDSIFELFNNFILFKSLPENIDSSKLDFILDLTINNKSRFNNDININNLTSFLCGNGLESNNLNNEFMEYKNKHNINSNSDEYKLLEAKDNEPDFVCLYPHETFNNFDSNDKYKLPFYVLLKDSLNNYDSLLSKLKTNPLTNIKLYNFKSNHLWYLINKSNSIGWKYNKIIPLDLCSIISSYFAIEISKFPKIVVENKESYIKNDILNMIFWWTEYHQGENIKALPVPVRSTNMSQIVDDKFDAYYIDWMNKKQVFEIILGVNSLKFKHLLNLCCAKIATLIKQLDQKEINKIIQEEEKYRRQQLQNNTNTTNQNENQNEKEKEKESNNTPKQESQNKN